MAFMPVWLGLTAATSGFCLAIERVIFLDVSYVLPQNAMAIGSFFVKFCFCGELRVRFGARGGALLLAE